MNAPTVCQIDTCGENRDSGKPWPAEYAVTREGRTIIVCACHADGWYDDRDSRRPVPLAATR